MKLVINKGYTLEVTSWENDGDNYNTKFKTVDTLEEAFKLYKICKEVFNSRNGVGNSMCREDAYKLIRYVEENSNMFSDLEEEDLEEDNLVDYFQDLAYELMGSSEDYDFRVCESVEITYSPEDIYLKEIKF
jgi:hypothetical protein